MSFVARGTLKALTFLAAWYLLFYLALGAHEGFHALAATALGARGVSVVYGYLWLGPLPLPFEGGCYVEWPSEPAAWQSGLVGLAGGLGTAMLIALLDRAIRPHGKWSRYLDYASNVHLGHQLLYGACECLWALGLVGWQMVVFGGWAGQALGVLLALLERNNVINI